MTHRVGQLAGLWSLRRIELGEAVQQQRQATRPSQQGAAQGLDRSGVASRGQLGLGIGLKLLEAVSKVAHGALQIIGENKRPRSTIGAGPGGRRRAGRRLAAKRGLGHLDHLAEGGGIANGEVGQHLAIDLHARGLQAGNEAAIREAVLA